MNGFLGDYNRFLQQNPGMVMGLASGLLSDPRNNRNAFAQGLQGALLGSQSDIANMRNQAADQRSQQLFDWRLEDRERAAAEREREEQARQQQAEWWQQNYPSMSGAPGAVRSKFIEQQFKEPATPKVVELIDPQGRAYKGVYNPDDVNADAQGFVRVGGVKGVDPEKVARSQRASQAAQDIVIENIDRALNVVEDQPVVPVTGMGGTIARQIPGTQAADLQRTVDTIKANVGFDKLQQMRDASPTGGALGQVSQQENVLLQSVLGSLDTSQTEEQFSYNLKRLKNTILDIVHGEGAGPQREPLQAPVRNLQGGGNIIDQADAIVGP